MRAALTLRPGYTVAEITRDKSAIPTVLVCQSLLSQLLWNSEILLLGNSADRLRGMNISVTLADISC